MKATIENNEIRDMFSLLGVDRSEHSEQHHSDVVTVLDKAYYKLIEEMGKLDQEIKRNRAAKEILLGKKDASAEQVVKRQPRLVRVERVEQPETKCRTSRVLEALSGLEAVSYRQLRNKLNCTKESLYTWVYSNKKKGWFTMSRIGKTLKIELTPLGQELSNNI
jgi:hypothetical protein